MSDLLPHYSAADHAGIIAGCLLVLLPAMGLFWLADLMGGAKNLLIGNVIKVQFLNIRDWPFWRGNQHFLTAAMGLLLYHLLPCGKNVKWKKGELE